MFFLYPKEEIKEFKFHSNFQQVSYEIFFLNVMEGLINSVWENQLLYRSE